MAGEVFCSCLICRIPLFYQRPVPHGIDGDEDDDDEYQSDDEDWRNIWHNDLRIHSSCLAIAIPAAADRKNELLAKLCHRSLRYDLFPLLGIIPHPASDPNQISKDLALALVRETNRSSWHNRIPEEICTYIALELTNTRLGINSPIPTLWSLYTKIQGRSNLAIILRNVKILLAWQNVEFFGSRTKNLPKEAPLVLCDELRDRDTSALVARDIATAVIEGPPRLITLHFNLALEQKYLCGITVNGESVGYKGVSDVTLEVTKGSQGLLLTFNQWGFQDGRVSGGSVSDGVSLSSQKETAYAVLYWPENLTKTTLLVTFDSCKCVGIGIKEGRVWTSRSISNLVQSPRPLIDCSISQNYQVNWCLQKFDCDLSDIQLAVNASNLAIHQISFKGIDGSVRSIGRHVSSDVQLLFPLSHKLGEVLSQIRVCHSSKKGFIIIQFITSFNRVFTIGDVPKDTCWSAVDWPSSIYAAYEVNKTGFCLFGIDSPPLPITSIGTLSLDFPVPSILPYTHYATAPRLGRSIAVARAPLYQLKSLNVFQFRMPHMLSRGSYVSYICGIQLFYVHGVSVVLGQLGESFEIQVPSRITDLKVWIFEDDEDFQVRGLEFHFEGGTDFQAVGSRHGLETKTFQEIEIFEWATGNMFSDVTGLRNYQ